MSGDLPEPLIGGDTDIDGLDGFMLNVERLMASELWALSTGEEFKAAVGLWCRAWKQHPAGSLPNDPRVLAAFSGAGARWPKIRDMALRGFVACNDGRLYHAVLCDDVRRAATKKQERRERTKAATEARKRERDEQRNVGRDVTRDGPPLSERDDPQKANVTTSHRQDRDRTGTEEKIPSSEKLAAPQAAPRERATRIPPGWTLDDDLRGWTTTELLESGCALPAILEWIEAELPAFVDYWQARPGKEALKLSWSATWRNRVRDQVKRGFGPRVQAPKASGNGHAEPHPSGITEVEAEAFIADWETWRDTGKEGKSPDRAWYIGKCGERDPRWIRSNGHGTNGHADHARRQRLWGLLTDEQTADAEARQQAHQRDASLPMPKPEDYLTAEQLAEGAAA